MKTISLLALVVVCGLLIGCVTSKNLARLDTGMTKMEVEKVMGKPHSVAKRGNAEFLIYYLEREGMGGDAEYYVLLVNGLVDSFGEKGSFDTTTMPVQRVEVRQR